MAVISYNELNTDVEWISEDIIEEISNVNTTAEHENCLPIISITPHLTTPWEQE